jgi:putative flippase GtrA
MFDSRSSHGRSAHPARSPLFTQLIKFGAVGGVGFVVNLVVFNLLRATIFSPDDVAHGPIYATIIATLVAIVTNWLGNRYWAFSAQRRTNTFREGLEFFLVSIVGMLIPLGCLWLSHYVLGFTSLLADNLANNVIGLALGTLFRFAFYRWWVFAPRRSAQLDIEPLDAPSAVAALPAQLAETASRPGAELPAAPDSGLVGER